MCLDLNNPEVRLSKDHNACNRPEVRQYAHHAQTVATGSRTHTVCLLKSHSASLSDNQSDPDAATSGYWFVHLVSAWEGRM